MLNLNSISLFQFKNYPLGKFEFTEQRVGIHGPNGFGKTNLLDAIYYLCFTRSYFTRSDAQLVLSGAQGFRVEGNFERNGQQHQLVGILRENGRKEFYLDGEQYDKLSAHIGKFPAVMIAPDDVYIITEASEERRRMIDAILSQTDPVYLQHLIDYTRSLQQRNSYLKSVDSGRPDGKLLDAYDNLLTIHGAYLHHVRKEFFLDFNQQVKSFYESIAGKNEGLQLEYRSQLNDQDHDRLLKMMRDKDIMLQRTGAGPHKDDLELTLNGKPFKTIASQGQRKSLLFALKLAEFETLRKNKGFSPLLLLDDVFEKLDENRMNNLLQFICLQQDVQLFITDTHGERIREQMSRISVNCQLIEIKAS